MGHHESGLVLNVQVPAQLQRGNALRAVREDRNGRENVPHRKLAAGEDGAGRNGELAGTALAAPHLAAGQVVQVQRTALGAERLPAIIGEPDGLESLVGVRVRHAEDLGKAYRPSLGRKEEMLGHLYCIRYFRNRYSTLTYPIQGQ